MVELTVTYTKQATKYIRRMPRKTAAALVDKINIYAANTEGSHPWAKPLTGMEGVRIRQGDYRAACSVIEETAIFNVYKIGNRKEIYR